jgi:hypothetical protein
MEEGMSSARFAPASARRLLRSAVVGSVALSAAAVTAVLPGTVAAADELPGTTVVGELVQAWEEGSPAEMAAGHEAEALISWVQPARGEPVLVDTEGVADVPVGSTVAVEVGRAQETAEDGRDAPRDVLAAELLAPAEVLPAPRTTGPLTNQVTVAMVAPAGSPAGGDGMTLGQVVGVVDGPVADFWTEQSNGTIAVGVTAGHEWLSAAADCSNPAALWDEVAARVGFVAGPGRHLVLYVGRQAGCAYALAEVGTAPSSGGRLYITDPTVSVVAHELGHNFGLGHSSAEQCDAVVEGGSCRTVAYRDHYDVMGVSWAQLGSLNAPQAARLGVLPESQQQALVLGGPTTTATLTPLSGRVGTRAVRLTTADSVDYWLEYRTATLRDQWLAGPANRYRLDTGVLLRRAGGLPDTSVLLDGTPGPAAGWDADTRTALPLGVPVPVSGGDFTVVVESVSAEGALVRVTPGPVRAGTIQAAGRTGAAPGGLLPGTTPPGVPAPGAGGAPVPAPVGAGQAVQPPAAPVGTDADADAGVPAVRVTPSLVSAAELPARGAVLAPLAGGLLAGSALLVVRGRRRSAARLAES